MLAMCRLERSQLPNTPSGSSARHRFANVEIDSVLKGLDKSPAVQNELVDAANANALETTDVYELRLTLSEDEAALYSLWIDPKSWIFGFLLLPG
ncbi:hypothetical protein BJ742DRAFT_770856 [Cladochytrium replicatum]|nr:hypothetical protein BJ742DRAFT_770856 [Cladochytrium replicatum]